MTKESNIKEQLLKQMDTASDADRKSIEEIFAKDEARVKRMKRATIIIWLLWLIFLIAPFAVVGILKHKAPPQGQLTLAIVPMIIYLLFLTAIVFTISFFLRSRRLNQRKIEARLSNIETLLKKMSKGQ